MNKIRKKTKVRDMAKLGNASLSLKLNSELSCFALRWHEQTNGCGARRDGRGMSEVFKFDVLKDVYILYISQKQHDMNLKINKYTGP